MYIEQEQMLEAIEAQRKYDHAMGTRDSLALYLEAFIDMEDICRDDEVYKEYVDFLTPQFLRGVNRILFGLWMDLYR